MLTLFSCDLCRSCEHSVGNCTALFPAPHPICRCRGSFVLNISCAEPRKNKTGGFRLVVSVLLRHKSRARVTAIHRLRRARSFVSDDNSGRRFSSVLRGSGKSPYHTTPCKIVCKLGMTCAPRAELWRRAERWVRLCHHSQLRNQVRSLIICQELRGRHADLCEVIRSFFISEHLVRHP